MTWLRRILLAIAILAAALIGGGKLFQTQIAQAAFNRAVDETIGRDRSAGLPDGLHVYVCGAGSPIPDPLRSGPCLGIIAGERVFVFDAGSGSPRNLARMGFPVGRVEQVYLTHVHSDHIDSLGELLLQAWVGGSRKMPLPVSGPSGTAQVVDGFNAAYLVDSTFRTAHHGVDIADPAGYGASARVIDLPKGPGAKAVVFDDGGVKITAFAVDHAPVEPAFGYRIDYAGRSVTLSGDTVYTEALIAAARDTDLLFHEALEPRLVARMQTAAEGHGRRALAKIFGDILDYHASPEDAARAAEAAGARHLVLYHIVPPLPSALLEPLFVGKAKDIFNGKITVARDGMIFSLPSNSSRIRQLDGF